ncbi:glycosyltransferase [Synechococcus sp. AH-558-M21]|nr:glycosyltransferase [Synechococcus sp. AH-558-M21]
MKLLFLHPNFPAQFKAPCIELASQEKHQIKFICQTHYGRALKGVEKLVLKGDGSHENAQKSYKSEEDRSIFRSKAYRASFIELKNNAWHPDITICHSGWGCGVHLKEIWPKTYFISYLEWWFDVKSDLISNLKINKYFQLKESSIQSLWTRNMPAALEMCTSDKIIAPTEWQKQQLPTILKEQCIVVRDNINDKIFFPEPKKLSLSPVVTYGTRGMEAMRGFPQFIEILPVLLRKWPQLTIEIAGKDTVSYGGILPKEKSWKKWALGILEEEGIAQRVKWLDSMTLENYANWLKQTWCHIYLTEPFVTSWSYIEASYCQIPMVASNTKGTMEFSHLSENTTLVNHNNQAELLEAVSQKLRLSGNTNCASRVKPSIMQTRTLKKLKTNESNLASLIADLEAPTKI